MKTRGRALLRLVAALAIAGTTLTPSALPMVRAAGPCDPPITNPIVCENSKTGNPASEWEVSGSGDSSIQGFATDISVNKGQTVSFKIRTVSPDYRVDIYRLGYYNGLGARKVATIQPSASLPQNQPSCLSNSGTGLVDCGNWGVSASWPVPADAVSGIYLARPVREDSGNVGKASHIPFIVRDDNGGSPMLFQTSDTTWHAYNSYGGNSLYVGAPVGRAYKVSYNRPFNTRDTQGGPQESYLFNSEYPMVRWLERNGYNVSYTTGVDSDRRGAELLEHDVFLSVGHDEYWSGAQRANVENARYASVNLAFFSANEVFWKTRWENSIDASNTPYRTLVSYKETHANAKIDPNPAWTGTWRDPRFSPPADGGKPENALTGTIFTVNGIRNDTMTVPAADGKMRFWRNTSVANLGVGQTATLTGGSLGYEWDEDLDNGFRPAGAFRMSSTTVNINGQYLLDYGSSYGAGIAKHSLVMYRHSSGALVFGSGTVQWPWGLDGTHDRGPSTPDANMQQATVNLFADMGVQPGTLQAGLVAATQTTDTAKPSSTITSPASGATVDSGVPVTITGTASDSGGQVGGVEVSTDNGATWHPATGRGTWSYTWTPAAPGATTIKSRATDDSGNIEVPGAGISVTVELPSGPLTVTFDDLGPGGTNLVGQYPSGVINWGTTTWYLSGPYGQFTTPNISFANPGVTTGTFTFVQPRRLISIRAFNGGGGSSTVTLACAGNTTKSQNVGANTAPTITTNWTTPCTTVTVTSSNGWDTNFDTLIHDAGTPDTAPPNISALQATNVSSNSATISWTTNEASDSQVEYGTTTSYGSSTTLNTSMVTSHSQGLSGLTPSTQYHYRVKSRDAAGNLATSGDFSFTTATPDTVPPTISAVQASNVLSNTATITWTTNEASDTQVEYGPTTSYGSSTTLNTSMVTSHSQGLSGLTPSTQYHYRVKSRDAAGNLATSGDFTFTTTASAPETVTFDDKPGENQPLNGQYPTGVINWGTSSWYHSGPWGALTSKSISFEDAGVTQRTFTFVNPRRLISVQAYNGGGASTLTLRCTGQPDKVTNLTSSQLVTINTGWTGTCTTVTVISSNGWDTNLDNLVHDGS